MRAAVAAALLLGSCCLAAVKAPAPPLPEPPAEAEAGDQGLRALLPAPLPGWTAGEPEAGSGPGALLGGGPSASRRYRAGSGPEKTVDVEVVAGSALVDSLAPLLADPAPLAGAPGASLVEVGGRKALRRLAPEDRTAEVSLVLAGRTLVVVRAQGVEGDAEALAYARALDLAALEAAVGP